MKTVSHDSQIMLRFKMQLEDGTEIESSFDEDPIAFQIGDGSLTSGMEDALIDQTEGTTVSVTLGPDAAFGLPSEDNIHQMPASDFPDDMKPEINQVIAFDGPDDSEILGTITAIEDDEVSVDFSHPLAGRTILFTAEIVEII